MKYPLHQGIPGRLKNADGIVDCVLRVTFNCHTDPPDAPEDHTVGFYLNLSQVHDLPDGHYKFKSDDGRYDFSFGLVASDVTMFLGKSGL